MAYSKTTWQTGDTVTAELLNHMEDGILAGNNELPSYNSSAGKKALVIKAAGNGVEWRHIVPNVSSADNGKILKVDNAQWAAVDPPASLPAVTSSDNGKVLTVSSGAWAAVTPSGGGGGVNVPEPTSGGGMRLLFANNAGTVSWTATNTFIKMTQMKASSYEGSTGVQLKNYANQNMSPGNLIAAMTNGAGFYIEDSYYPGCKLLPAFIEYRSMSSTQYRYDVYCIVDSSGTMSMYYTTNDTKTT